MSELKTLQTMDDNELLGKVDELFEWIAKQAGDGSIEIWTLAGLQTEIRRRIMERHAAIAIEPEKIKVEVRSIQLRPEHPVDASFLININATACCIALRNQKFAVENTFLSLREVQAYLKGLKAVQSFGVRFESVPEVSADI